MIWLSESRHLNALRTGKAPAEMQVSTGSSSASNPTPRSTSSAQIACLRVPRKSRQLNRQTPRSPAAGASSLIGEIRSRLEH